MYWYGTQPAQYSITTYLYGIEKFTLKVTKVREEPKKWMAKRTTMKPQHVKQVDNELSELFLTKTERSDC